jgi:hypothetical protein
MSRSSTSVHVTKLAAAQRQLDAAIRMTFGDEDELAIHTVVAAAYRILRDLKNKRGSKDEWVDGLNRGLFYIARDFAAGKMDGLPPEVLVSSRLTAGVRAVADAIKRGDVKSRFDVDFFKPTGQEDAAWRAFNIPSNFLKHADRDKRAALRLNQVDNDFLILAACAAYRDLMGGLTPEMAAYGAYRFADEWDGPVLGVSVLKLRRVPLAQRRQLCLQLIRNSQAKGQKPRKRRSSRR